MASTSLFFGNYIFIDDGLSIFIVIIFDIFFCVFKAATYKIIVFEFIFPFNILYKFYHFFFLNF